jgi:hypothetical protein
MDKANETLKDKFSRYEFMDDAIQWFSLNFQKLSDLFSNYTLRDYIFEPFKGVFQSPKKSIDSDIYLIITSVALLNAVLAGLPGKLGVGVYVSMAFELWMAYRIAQHVGIELSQPKDIAKYFGLLIATVGTVLYLFRMLLGLGFSLFSFVSPIVNPLIFAEILVTDFIGVLFLVGFTEAKQQGEFVIPKRMYGTLIKTTKDIYSYQYSILKGLFNWQNIKKTGQKIKQYVTGESVTNQRQANGELFATAAMAYLLSAQYEKLEGPLGQAFIEAIRLRWSAQFDEATTVEEMALRFSEYDTEAMVGVVNTIKGKIFEILVTQQDNTDGDLWFAKMHTDESYPGSDIVFTHSETGEQLEISLKAVSEHNPQIIEHALARYPDLPIMTTEEVMEHFQYDERVMSAGMSHENLQDITKENIDKLIGQMQVNEQEVILWGVQIGFIAALWPFVIAYFRNKIDGDDLEKVFLHVLGESGVALASRVTYGLIFGPLFAWYLLARGIYLITQSLEPEREGSQEVRLLKNS